MGDKKEESQNQGGIFSIMGGVTKKLPLPKESTVKLLNGIAANYRKGFEAGEEYRKNSTDKWGVNPLPGEPDWEIYYREISSPS